MSSRLRELRPLFTSETRIRVLARLLLHTAQEFYQSQIASLDSLQLKAVQRELDKLVRFGLIRRKARGGRRRVYQAERDHPLYPELKAMLLKTILLGTRSERLKKPPLSNIDVAFVYGSIARADEDAKSDIDIMAIGALSTREWQSVVEASRLEEIRAENSIVMPKAEFQKRYSAGEDFLRRIITGPKIFLMGGQDDLSRLAEEAKDSAAQANS